MTQLTNAQVKAIAANAYLVEPHEAQALAIQLTTDETAAGLGLSRLTVRPRFSELRARHQVVDTGARRLNDSGKRAIVWAVDTVEGTHP